MMKSTWSWSIRRRVAETPSTGRTLAVTGHNIDLAAADAAGSVDFLRRQLSAAQREGAVARIRTAHRCDKAQPHGAVQETVLAS